MKQLAGYNVQLKSVEFEDLELLRGWRNDPQVSQFMLSQELISKEQQTAWFNKIQRDPAQQHWLIYYKQQPIGSANIKAIYQGQTLRNATTIEPGLYIGDKRYRGNLLAFAPTLLINDYCFEQLKVKQLHAVVKQSNQAALNYNLKLGYKIQKQAELVEITLTERDYQQASQTLKRFLSR
ncbi:GNAT family N-acetyltransferase [Neptunicella sp. SCSIO 80796]|uniref:GNAT family N-acetyltransferase n=1 Tax=Neptunicella plasticusilytica TaxID=3117012 RepID=UPI003A4D3096